VGVERSFFTPISLWRVLCEWGAVVTAPLMLPSSHDLSLHLQFRHCRQSTVVAFGQGFGHQRSKARGGLCRNILESVAVRVLAVCSAGPCSARPYSKDAVVTAP
jgi:hypothetical protein